MKQSLAKRSVVCAASAGSVTVSNAIMALRNLFIAICTFLIIAQWGPDVGLVWLAGVAAPIVEGEQ